MISHPAGLGAPFLSYCGTGAHSIAAPLRSPTPAADPIRFVALFDTQLLAALGGRAILLSRAHIVPVPSGVPV